MKTKGNYSGYKGALKAIANVITWVSLIILVFLALFLGYYTINNKLYESRGEKFEPFISLYTIVSGSMEPNIKVYDVVVSKKVSSPNKIKVGDVITFVSTSSISKGMTVTHRVIEVVNTDKGVAYRTQGDNNLGPDSSPAQFENVIGKVVFRLPQLGRLQEFLSKKGGWLIAIIIPALGVIIYDILKLFKLTGVKKEIDKINERDAELKNEQIRREEARKQLLKKRLNVEPNDNEPDPIVTKKMTRIVVAGNPVVKKQNDFKDYDNTNLEKKNSNSNSKSKKSNHNKKTNSSKKKKNK